MNRKVIVKAINMGIALISRDRHTGRRAAILQTAANVKKQILRVAALLLTFAGAITLQGAEPATGYLIKDGQALGKLYLPANAGRATRFAAEELMSHLRKITGAELRQAWREIRRGESGIVLEVREREEWRDEESAQAFTIAQTGKPSVVLTISGNTDLAVLYGVYQYLSDLGMRWFSPGEIGTYTPRMADIQVAENSRTYSPSFLLRSLDLSGTDKGHFGGDSETGREELHYEYDLWILRNRLQFRRTIHNKHGFDFNHCPGAGGHALRRMTGLAPHGFINVQATAEFERTPERFPMITVDGTKQRAPKGGQICFSNKQNIKDAIENCVKCWQQIESEPNDLNDIAMVSMALADTGGICECDECSKIAGDPPNNQDRLVWYFMNKVARGLNERMPGRTFALYAPYYDLKQPPADVKIEPNIVAVSCRSYSWNRDLGQAKDDPFSKDFREWITNTRKAGAQQAAYDYVLMALTPQPLDILDAATEYAKLGYQYYHPEVMQRSEQLWPVLWALAQFSWNTQQDPHELLEQYCQQYYGEKNGELVLWILKTMHDNSRNCERICYGGLNITSTMLPQDFTNEARKKLKNALRSTQGKQLARLQRLNASMEVHFKLAELYRTYANTLNFRTPDSIVKLRKMIADFSTFWDENRVSALFSPSVLERVAAMGRVDVASLAPKARRNYAENRELLLVDLFAQTEVPAEIPNLFILPEIWKLRLDPDKEGVRQQWFAPDCPDAEGWQNVSTWNFIESQGYGDARTIGGDFWYRLRFTPPTFPANKKIFLRIGSLDETGIIYLNGVRVGAQPEMQNWNKSFVMDVTEALKPGAENVLTIHGNDAEGAAGLWRPSALYTN